MLVCHAPADAPLADGLATALTRGGYPARASGTVDVEAAPAAVEAVRCVIILLSPAADAAAPVAQLVSAALAQQRPILPIRIDGPDGGALASRLATLPPIDGRGQSASSIARATIRRLETGWSIFPPIGRPFRPLGVSPWTLGGVLAAILVAALLVIRPFDARPLGLSDLQADDFRPQVTGFDTEGTRGRWRVDIGPSARVIASGLLDVVESIDLSIDGRDFVPRRFFPAPIDGAAGATAIHLRLVGAGGATAGPFRYPLDFLAEARARMKARIEEGGWAGCTRATCFLRFTRNAGAIREVRWGFDDGPLNQAVKVDVPVDRFDDMVWIDGNPRIPHQFMVPRGAQSMSFQVIYVDGTEGAVHRVPPRPRP